MEVVLGRGNGSLTGPLQDGSCVRQSFIAKALTLESVSILFSTYKRANPGTLVVELLDGGSLISSCVFPALKLRDNAYAKFPMSAELVVGSEYEIRISTRHCRSGMSPTAHYGTKRGNTYLFIGSRQVKGELMCKMDYFELGPSKSVTFNDDFTLSSFISSGMLFLSIVILNKDRFDLISKCVDSILRNAPGCEVIIGDTGSKDERVLELYDRLPDRFKVVKGLDYHFSKNNNFLANEHATGSHVLFLNNDVFLEEGCIDRMMEYASCYKFGAVGLRLMKERGVIDHDGQLLWDNGKLRTPDHDNVNRPPSMVKDCDKVTQGVTAACMLTTTQLFKSLGGFDESYEDVYQDCDYCMKLAEGGFQCVTVRQKSAVHVGSATRGVTTESNEAVNRDRKRYIENWKQFVLPERPLFSVVTCCNDAGKYMGMAKTLPERTGEAVEMIPVVNAGNRLSITRALNIGLMAAQGRWIVYCHQDVLYPRGWVGRMRRIMLKLEEKGNVGAVGFEGLAKGGVPYSCKHVNPNTPVRVQTLDELCLVTPLRDEFDEGFEYHYYGADFCLAAEDKGYINYLAGLHVKHLSDGAGNIMADIEGFRAQAEMLRRKWPDFNFFTTTTKFIKGGIYYMILPEVLNEQKD